MSGWEPDAEPEETSVSIDAYGIKMQLQPHDLGEPAPASLKDVLRQVRGHLLRIAVAPTRLIAELLEGTTRLVRGLSRVPTAVADRIGEAHRTADAAEAKRQHQITAGARGTLPPAPDAVDRINTILEKYRALGRDAYVVFGPDDTVIIVLGTPPERDELSGGAVEQLRLPDSGTNDSPQ